MGLRDDLVTHVTQVFSSRWQEDNAISVPAPESLALDANHAKTLQSATVLYADLDSSTAMVDTQHWTLSAEVYQTFLRCAARLIRYQGGTVTSYDGDRVMGVFVGEGKNTRAVKCALNIHFAVYEIIRPAFRAQYPQDSFVIKHVVGIDSSPLRAVRIGVRGDNDITWVGSAANWAAKLTGLSGGPTWISESIFQRMNDSVKLSKGVSMWTSHPWQGRTVYSSNFYSRF
jgi:class 3 adenylate cyclase